MRAEEIEYLRHLPDLVGSQSSGLRSKRTEHRCELGGSGLGEEQPVGHCRSSPAEASRCRAGRCCLGRSHGPRSEEHTSELQSLMRNSYAVFCLKKKNNENTR